jgi:hypothetical protein
MKNTIILITILITLYSMYTMFALQHPIIYLLSIIISIHQSMILYQLLNNNYLPPYSGYMSVFYVIILTLVLL